MASAQRGSFERGDAVSRDGVENGSGEVGVVRDAVPVLERLVGGEDHEAAATVALVDDMEQDLGRVGAVGEIADQTSCRAYLPRFRRLPRCVPDSFSSFSCGRRFRSNCWPMPTQLPVSQYNTRPAWN